MVEQKLKIYKPLSEFIVEYVERNADNKFSPVAVGKYGIRRRESIYSKELASDYSKNKLIFKNTLTVGMGSKQIDIGVLIEDVTYSVSPAYHTYRISNIDAKYLDYCIQCRNQDMFSRFVKRGSRQGKTVDLKRWLTYEIPVYDESTQKEIVDRLNRANLLITQRKQQLELLEQLIKARFVEMFGTLYDNENGFDVVTMEDVCSLVKDGTHQTPQYTEDRNEGFKFLSSKDVMSQKIDWTDIKYIPAELHEKLYATIKPQRNDILMSKNGVNYGVAAVNDTDEVFDIYVSLALLRPKEIIDPVFLRCVINNYETKRQFDSSIKGIGVPNLHLGEIKKTKIFLPPMELQKEFVSFVEQVDKSKLMFQKLHQKLNILQQKVGDI